MFMRTVQQNVFLILNSVPVTSVTDPELIRVRVTQLYPPARAVELIRPSIPVMTHSLD